MLKKLLKYDLKDIYKTLIIFYILSFVFAIFTRLFFCIENSTIFSILGYIASGTLISMIINIFINNLMRVWTLYVKNIYGTKSYLTHTLPVKKNSIYLSKVMSSGITMFTSILVIVVDLFIAYYSKELLTTIKTSLQIISLIYDSNVLNLLLIMFFVFFLEMLFILQCGFTGIILGHMSNNKKIIKSIFFGFIYYLCFQILTLLILFIIGLNNSEIMNMFVTNNFVSFNTLKFIMFVSIFVYTIYIVFTYFINKILFEKGVNVD